MQLLLIRHADPDYPNHTITEKGHRQAELLALSLQRTRIDRLVVSPMRRAQHTADYLIRLRGIDFTVHEFLRELNGRYNDTDWAWGHHGCDLLAPGHDVTKTNWQDHVPYGEHMGPVYAAFIAQVDAFLAELGLLRSGYLYSVVRQVDETIAVVCHAGVIQTLLSHLLHVPLPVAYSQLRIDPSSVTRLQLETKDRLGVFRLVSLNDMSHTASMPESVGYRIPER